MRNLMESIWIILVHFQTRILNSEMWFLFILVILEIGKNMFSDNYLLLILILNIF